MTVTLQISDVWKAYPDWSGQPRTLRGAFAERTPLISSSRKKRWALKGVSLELEAGQSVGLVGHNGAGKSTLLRLAAKIGRPTRGSLTTDPDTSYILNLGTALDPQLTGRENAYTAALIAGLTRREAAAAVPLMLDFSDLEEFAEWPVRTYSEGMKLRLSFGIVATRAPRLLVLDEVLAVGDTAFRAKCADRIAEMQAAGTSVVLASHSVEEVVSTCSHAIWLHKGAERAFGDATTVVDEYERAMHETTLARTPVGSSEDTDQLKVGENRFGTLELALGNVRVRGGDPGDDEGVSRLRTGEPLRVDLDLTARDAPVDDPIVTVTIRRRLDDLILVDLSTRATGHSLGRGITHAKLGLRLDHLDLPAGEYAVDVGVHERNWEHAYDFHYGAYPLRVDGTSGAKGVMVPPHRWTTA